MTGLTYDIENGKITTGKDFLMACARCYMIPRMGVERFEPLEYYKESLNTAIEKLKKIAW